MKLVVAGNMPREIREFLFKRGFELYFTRENPFVLKGLGFHPDMQACRVENKIICTPQMYDSYLDLASSSDFEVICGKTELRSNYPHDIAYNIKIVGNRVFHNFNYTDCELKEAIDGKKKIDVHQGYSGCSVCAISDNAIITSDILIHKKACLDGMNSLLINDGCILLEGFDHGFIGGASFSCDGRVFFFGDIRLHPDFERIEEFCSSMCVEIVCMDNFPLSDYGGAIVLN